MPQPSLTAALAATAAGTEWIPIRFEAAYPGASCTGEALTVALVAGDNLALHRALNMAQPGAVLVVAASGKGDAGHWGSLMTRAALAREIGGLVIDGSIRDRAELRELGLPVFFRSTCPRKARKEHPGTVGDSIRIGGVAIRSGDRVIADEDGIVVIPAAVVAAFEEEARALAADELEIERALTSGV
jgi:4-hydroxy-4-methyl-2-oxoglutarate aldolase